MTTAITKALNYMEANAATIAAEVPDDFDMGRAKRTVQALLLQADRDKSKLSNCTTPSIVHAVLRVVHLGLDLDNKEAHIVVYGKEATVMIDYRGLLVLARRGGLSKVEADVVREGDAVEYGRGDGPGETYFRHSPVPFNTAPIVGAYAMFWQADGSFDFDVMNMDEINATRKKAASGSGAWRDTPWEMYKKAVLRRGLKRLPMRDDDRKALMADDARHMVHDVTPDAERNQRLNAAFAKPQLKKVDTDVYQEVAPSVDAATVIDMETGEIDPDMSAAPYVPGADA